MRIDVWLGFLAEARPDGVRLPKISLGLVFQAMYSLRSCVRIMGCRFSRPGPCVTPARSLMFRCSALNVMLCAFTTLIVGHVRSLFLVVGPVSTVVCALGLWFDL